MVYGRNPGFFVMNDISSNQLAAFSHHSINAVVPATIEMIWGHIIYRNREKLYKSRYAVASIFAFVLINIVRTWIQRNRYYMETPNNYILYWYSSLGLLCAACIVVFGLALPKLDKETPFSKAICFLGSYTFSIYLLHQVISKILNRFGVQSWLQSDILGGRTAFIYEVAYSACIVLIIFSLALLSSVLLKQITRALKRVGKLVTAGDGSAGDKISLYSSEPDEKSKI